MITTLFLPVTRAWAAERVVAAFAASDIPRHVILLIDNNEIDASEWVYRFMDASWTIEVYATDNPPPPEDRLARRLRHIQMRRLSQSLTAGRGRVLYSEDDTLVPPDVWTRLSDLLDHGYVAASGIQYDRAGTGMTGVWRYDEDVDCFDPLVWPPDAQKPDLTIRDADAVGHYCLLVDGDDYANALIPLDDSVPVDRAHTFQLRPIAVDENVWCGHLLEDGTILCPTNP